MQALAAHTIDINTSQATTTSHLPLNHKLDTTTTACLVGSGSLDTTCSIKATSSQQPFMSILDTTTISMDASSNLNSTSSLKNTTSQDSSKTQCTVSPTCSVDKALDKALANNDKMLEAFMKLLDDRTKKSDV